MSNQAKSSDGVGGTPTLISKKWLCFRFNLTTSGRPNYQQLYKKVLTPEVLENSGLNITDIRNVSVRTFDALTSAKIKQALALPVFVLLSFIGYTQTPPPVPDKPGTYIYLDSIPGIAMVWENQRYYTHAFCDVVGCMVNHPPVSLEQKVVVLVDAYTVTEGIIVVDGFGKQTPRVTRVRHNRLNDCTLIDPKTILFFKQL